ncbi:hypothetical protein [Nibrella saemangeumensis]
METTFVLKREELTAEWLEQLKEHLTEDSVITITATSPEKESRYNPQEVLAHLDETRRMHPPKRIPADIDINKVIDEMYWEGNH